MYQHWYKFLPINNSRRVLITFPTDHHLFRVTPFATTTNFKLSTKWYNFSTITTLKDVEIKEGRPILRPVILENKKGEREGVKKREGLEEGYVPGEVERGWYEWWKGQGYFQSKISENNMNPFVMILPPPNVTGKLHIGHALTLSIQDTLARYHRMLGRPVTWIPGTDHAGIGTQAVVERKLWQERQLTRHDLTREEFLEILKQFQTQYGRNILDQMARLGASVDWEQEFFTLDPTRTKAVHHAFISLFQQGLLYRATRIVNWCPALTTVISDIEVEYETIDKPTSLQVPGLKQPVEFGVLYHIAYPLVTPSDTETHLVVVTTRPETMLGDVALAVHPQDPRYQHLIGQYVHHPALKGVTLPIIGDETLVKREVGTGVVKISPAHDANDYACHLRHQLPLPPSIFDNRGHIIPNPTWSSLSGLHRFEAREQILVTLGPHYLRKVPAPTTTLIPRCTRSGDIIEPTLQPQWYIKMSELANQAIEVVRSGEIQLHPTQFQQDWERWLNDSQDWCISRQLVWGHRIPAYRVTWLNKLDPSLSELEQRWFVGEHEPQVMDQIKVILMDQYQDPSRVDEILSQVQLNQDEDVLDTWFSSALLPLSTRGWPEVSPTTPHLPTDLLETGSDILFFWVARMVMLCTHLRGIPFRKVLLHPMVRDRYGRKMSKSVGNVIDPLHVMDGIQLEALQAPVRSLPLPPSEIDRSLDKLASEFPDGIPACGTDALRFTLLSYLQQGRNINMNVDNVVATRHFINKLWQLVRFYLNRHQRLEGGGVPIRTYGVEEVTSLQPRSLLNKFLLSKLASAVEECHSGLESLSLHQLPLTMRRFVVNVVCDTVVEFAKPIINASSPHAIETIQILGLTLDVILRLLHPAIPYVTEHLWHHLPHHHRQESLMVASYPLPSQFQSFKDPTAEVSLEQVLKIIHASRSLRQSHHLNPHHPFPFHIYITGPSDPPSDSPWLLPHNPVLAYQPEILQLALMSDLTLHQVPHLPDSGYSYPLHTTTSPPHHHHSVHLFVPHPTHPHHVDLPKLRLHLPTLHTKLTKLRHQHSTLLATTLNPHYHHRVPQPVQDQHKLKLAAMEVEIRTLKANLEQIERLLV